MKILLVNDYKEKIAGAEMHTWLLKENLEKKGHIVKIFGTNISKTEYYISLKNKSILYKFKKIFNFKSYFEFKKFVKEYNPDIIHIHNIFNELSPSILLASKVPLIMTVHDNQIINAVSILSARTGKECKTRICTGCLNCVGLKGMLLAQIRKVIYRILLQRISLFITPSKYMSSFIKEAGFNPVMIIHNGIDLYNFSPVINFNQLLYVGRITKDKGIEYLVRALPDVIKKCPNVELKVIGDGSDMKYIKGLADELNILNNIIFTGLLPTSIIKKHFQHSTILIVPSVMSDNFPTVCLEAMSIGRPIIASDTGGIPELVQNNINGFLVPKKNYKILSLKMIQLLSNKNLILTMAKKSNEKAKSFSIVKYIEKIEEIYKVHTQL